MDGTSRKRWIEFSEISVLHKIFAFHYGTNHLVDLDGFACARQNINGYSVVTEEKERRVHHRDKEFLFLNLSIQFQKLLGVGSNQRRMRGNEEIYIEMERMIPKDVGIENHPTNKDVRSSLVSLFHSSKRELLPRTVGLSGKEDPNPFPPNVIRNQKYSLLTFIPLTLIDQFKIFINFYYLILCFTQFIPVLKIGYLSTKVAPLAFVIILAMSKEAFDDYKRKKRDSEINSERYRRLTPHGLETIRSKDIKVGHLIQVEEDQRVPADMILLRSSAPNGTSFIRTDQLDGETDQKQRRAVTSTQELDDDQMVLKMNSTVFADKPITDIHKFVGNFITEKEVYPLCLDHTLWGSSFLANGTVIGLVVYTGTETRSGINTNDPPNKKGALYTETNRMTMILFVLQFLLASIMTIGGKFKGIWWLNFFRFLILIGGIIPISMRVCLDISKLFYAFQVLCDSEMPECTTRNTNIPEECGRVSILLSDKTGTLTQNNMEFKQFHVGTWNFKIQTQKERISSLLRDHYQNGENELADRVYKMMIACSLCHSVSITQSICPLTRDPIYSFQAASPDEMELVSFSSATGMVLSERTHEFMSLTNLLGETESYQILQCFPFVPRRRRMGIVVRKMSDNQIIFFAKGADCVIGPMAPISDWLEPECTAMAGCMLRTLVFAQRILTEEEYNSFETLLNVAKSSVTDREESIYRVVDSYETGFELLGISGVEDKLQEGVASTLDLLRRANINTWMLTGDKRETATCISRACGLVSHTQTVIQMSVTSITEALDFLKDFSQHRDSVLVIDGDSLEICLSEEVEETLFQATRNIPSLICCRCSPTQKAQMVEMVKKFSVDRIASIGDGGNDVSMIQAAHVGIGIEGKEGKQAALASDFSIQQFKHIAPLFLWHGRNAYQSSSAIGQVVMHRGMIICFLQMIYCATFYFSPTTFISGFLVFGYSCWYTVFPIFALVFDKEMTKEQCMARPELYTELQKGRYLSHKTFTIWILVSLFEALLIFASSLFMLASPWANYHELVAVSFTVLVLVEMLNICMIVRTWSSPIVISLLVTAGIYAPMMIFLPGYYELQFVANYKFWLKSFASTLITVAPVLFFKKSFYFLSRERRQYPSVKLS